MEARCPVTAPSSLDLLAIDITDLPDARVGSIGEMATLIAPTITIDEVAEATRSTGREVLTALGSRVPANDGVQLSPGIR